MGCPGALSSSLPAVGHPTRDDGQIGAHTLAVHKLLDFSTHKRLDNASHKRLDNCPNLRINA